VLVVIDGLGAAPLRRALAEGHAPHVARLLAGGARFDEAISPFPSLTPVCLATIATGAGPEAHRIPSLSWYQRGEGRFVEYGSSFAAAGVEGAARTIEDVILNLNHLHLAEDPPTLFESFQDAGQRAAAVNFLVWRGRTRHTVKHDYRPVSSIAKRRKVHAVYGPDHLYFGELYGDPRSIPQVGIKRPKDWGGGIIARQVLRSTDSRFVLLYLGQHDSASHKLGPDDTQRAIRGADRAVGRLVDMAGGVDRFLDEFAFVLCADHGQTPVRPGCSFRIEEVFDDVTLFRGSRTSDATHSDIAISPSNRFAMAYRLREGAPSADWIASRALEADAVDVVTYERHGKLVIRREAGELRARRCEPDTPGALATRRALAANEPERWLLEGDLDVLGLEASGGEVDDDGRYPDALHRICGGVQCINTGDVLVSATEGYEFVDIGGSSHAGGGSHGSLLAGDSIAPLITAGLSPELPPLPLYRLADIAPLIRSHAGLAAL
jgi:predicted AlkP superfamily pyrophosphatase or phosphodiesterase